ncbi:FKBP-type peptidyl-prolyl cis-trans isomerase, partial [Candidatus Protofrankia datiscae]
LPYGQRTSGSLSTEAGSLQGGWSHHRGKAGRMGVSVETLSPGDGKTFPRKGDTVKIHYVGTLLDGTKFDSSRDRGSPFVTQIGVGKVIKGWDEGVPQLSLGQKAVLTVTPDLAYGSHGFPPVIPPNSTLRFEVELLGIKA